MPPCFKNKHLENVKTALLLHSGPAVDVDDIHRKLAYYDALLERAALDRVLPKDTFAAFDAFWIAGEYDKAYDFVAYYPTGNVDPEQRAFASELWNLLDAQRWEAVERMEANGDRVKRYFGSGVQPLPATWHQTAGFDGDSHIQFYFNENVDALITSARVSVYPIMQDAFRPAIINTRVRVADENRARIVTDGPLLDFIDRPRMLWCELQPNASITLSLSYMPTYPMPDGLCTARLVVFLDGWKGSGPRLARR